MTVSVPDNAVARRDPGRCQAEYLDQPVARTPSTNHSATARSRHSVTPSGRSSALPGTLRATCACGSPTSGSSSPAMPCPTTTSAGSTPHSTDPMPPRALFAYALMIRGGIPTAQTERYLHQRAWLTDAARLLDRAPDALAAELVESMVRSGSIVVRQGRLHADAKHAPGSLHVPFPRAWPAPSTRPA